MKKDEYETSSSKKLNDYKMVVTVKHLQAISHDENMLECIKDQSGDFFKLSDLCN